MSCAIGNTGREELKKMTNANTNTNAVKSNYLTLRKCAYIFDWSNNTYFYGTHQQYLEKEEDHKALYEYYEKPEKCEEAIPYYRDQYNNIYIMMNNRVHYLGDLQIKSISEKDNIINHRRHIEVEKIAKNTPHFHRFCNNDLISNKYRSLQFEFMTGEKDLGYTRVSFKGWYHSFIIDDRTGELYTKAESGRHNPITAKKNNGRFRN